MTNDFGNFYNLVILFTSIFVILLFDGYLPHVDNFHAGGLFMASSAFIIFIDVLIVFGIALADNVLAYVHFLSIEHLEQILDGSRCLQSLLGHFV